MGNTLRQAAVAKQDDCNTACPGDAKEICGASLRIQVYKDSTWFDPTASQLAAAFQDYFDTLDQFRVSLNQYKSDLQDWQSETKNSKLKRLIAWARQSDPGPATLTAQQAATLSDMKLQTGNQQRILEQLSL